MKSQSNEVEIETGSFALDATPMTNEWRKSWAGESQYVDPIVESAVEVMQKIELGEQHMMLEKNREIENLREVLRFVANDKIANAADMRYRAARALKFFDK